MSGVDTALLGALVAAQGVTVVAVSRLLKTLSPPSGEAESAPEPATADAPAAAPSYSERDREVEAIIRKVDPSWSLGDPRDHIKLLPDAEGHICEAVRA